MTASAIRLEPVPETTPPRRFLIYMEHRNGELQPCAMDEQLLRKFIHHAVDYYPPTNREDREVMRCAAHAAIRMVCQQMMASNASVIDQVRDLARMGDPA